jgi:hypothetical protein
MPKPKPKNVVSNKLGFNTHYYRTCFNHQVFEMLSALDSISATATVKVFSGTEYRISSVDGEAHRISLFVNKLWDLILLKLTEIVFYDRDYNSEWRRETGRNKENPLKWYKGGRWEDEDDEDFDDRKNWWIYMSVKTIAQCLGASPKVDALTHLYDRIVAASKILRNIDIEITPKTNGKVINARIDGYLDFTGVRECSSTEERYLTKSNALFVFKINPKLIDYVAEQNMGFYPFNHSWFDLPEHCQNAYAAAKRLARHYNQNTYGRKNTISDPAALMKIGTLRYCLPKLNSKHEGENRVALRLSVCGGIQATIMAAVKDNYTRSSKNLLQGLALVSFFVILSLRRFVQPEGGSFSTFFTSEQVKMSYY